MPATFDRSTVAWQRSAKDSHHHWLGVSTNTELGSFLFGFGGRIDRAKYWTAVAIYIGIIVTFVLTGTALIAIAPGLILLPCVALVVVYLPLINSSFAVGIKRLQDRGKSGWWLLVFCLLRNVLRGIAVGGGNIAIEVASYAVAIWALVELGILRSTSGPNRHGPDPLAA